MVGNHNFPMRFADLLLGGAFSYTENLSGLSLGHLRQKAWRANDLSERGSGAESEHGGQHPTSFIKLPHPRSRCLPPVERFVRRPCCPRRGAHGESGDEGRGLRAQCVVVNDERE